MSRILTVIGATGTQGGSVISAMLDNPGYSLRAITRNTESTNARRLSEKGVQVVEADLNNKESLRHAFQGSHAIFAMTNFFDTLAATSSIEKAISVETQQAQNLADAAAATVGLEHYVWSSLPHCARNTGERFKAPYFVGKNVADDYIRASLPALWAKTTILWIGWYATNMLYPTYAPNPLATFEDPTGKHTRVHHINIPADTRVPLLGSPEINPGLWVRAILQQPNVTLPGKAVAAIEGYLTFEELVTAYFRAGRSRNASEDTNGGKLHIVQVSADKYAEMWPIWGEVLAGSHEYMASLPDGGFISVNREIEVLGRKDLAGLEGLVSTVDAFERMAGGNGD